MIKIKYETNKISIKGHANYSSGEDIVCASVSSIMYTTVNALLKFDSSSITYKDDGKEVNIIINKNDDITNTLINNMMSLFLELVSKYPNNIKVESEE